MRARPSHIPRATERAALQEMSLTKGLPAEQLHPAGTQIIAGMLRKGWIERQPDDGSIALPLPAMPHCGPSFPRSG
jgi:hypothetical protein